MATHVVQFHTAGDHGGEYNISVKTGPDATDEQIVDAAIVKANQPLRKLNRGGYEVGMDDGPTVHGAER